MYLITLFFYQLMPINSLGNASQEDRHSLERETVESSSLSPLWVTHTWGSVNVGWMTWYQRRYDVATADVRESTAAVLSMLTHKLCSLTKEH